MKNLLFEISLLLFITASFFAQNIPQMRVVNEGKILKSELIDKNITDANGDVCAGILIKSNLSGLLRFKI